MIDNILFLNRIYTPAIPKEPVFSPNKGLGVKTELEVAQNMAGFFSQ